MSSKAPSAADIFNVSEDEGYNEGYNGDYAPLANMEEGGKKRKKKINSWWVTVYYATMVILGLSAVSGLILGAVALGIMSADGGLKFQNIEMGVNENIPDAIATTREFILAQYFNNVSNGNPLTYGIINTLGWMVQDSSGNGPISPSIAGNTYYDADGVMTSDTSMNISTTCNSVQQSSAFIDRCGLTQLVESVSLNGYDVPLDPAIMQNFTALSGMVSLGRIMSLSIGIFNWTSSYQSMFNGYTAQSTSQQVGINPVNLTQISSNYVGDPGYFTNTAGQFSTLNIVPILMDAINAIQWITKNQNISY